MQMPLGWTHTHMHAHIMDKRQFRETRHMSAKDQNGPGLKISAKRIKTQTLFVIKDSGID